MKIDLIADIITTTTIALPQIMNIVNTIIISSSIFLHKIPNTIFMTSNDSTNRNIMKVLSGLYLLL